MAQSKAGQHGNLATSLFKQPIVVVLVILILLGATVSAVAGYRVLSGAPVSYPNQQLRLLVGGIGQVFLAGALMAQHFKKLALTLLLVVFSIGAIVGSLILA